jgi:hypothetical protein
MTKTKLADGGFKLIKQETLLFSIMCVYGGWES